MVEPVRTPSARPSALRSRARRAILSRWTLGLFGGACLLGAATHFAVGCNGYDPRDPFMHDAPDVETALARMDAGDYASAEEVLGHYLGTGVCDKGKIGIPETVRQKPDGTFDLGLILFYLGEKYGRPFGDEEKGDGDKLDPAEADKRGDEIDCALLILGAIAGDDKVPLDLRARAAYLEGNLEFLRQRYQEAVRFYDQALRLIPGVIEEAGGDGIGRDAAWNRAIALRRIEDKKDAGPDAADDAADGADGADSPDAQPDGGADGSDGGNGGPDGADGNNGDQDGGDAGNDAGDAGDGGRDASPDADPKNGQPDAGPPDAGEPDGGDPQNQEPSHGQPDSDGPDDSEQESQQQEDQLLDKYDQTPTYQQQEAKRRGGRRTMEDK